MTFFQGIKTNITENPKNITESILTPSLIVASKMIYPKYFQKSVISNKVRHLIGKSAEILPDMLARRRRLYLSIQ